jgi:hypothetical protein
VYHAASQRRGTVFAEAYNPEEEDESKVALYSLNLYFARWSTLRRTSSGPGYRSGSSRSSSSAPWTRTSCRRSVNRPTNNWPCPGHRRNV